MKQGAEQVTMNTSMNRPMKARRFKAGFTLLELMIVVAIVAILSAIAYPSYSHYVIKTRRTAAKACLSEFSNFMERYYTTNLRYDQSSDTTPVPIVEPTLDCEGTQQTGNYYSYNFGTPTASAYTVSAIPTAAQVDPECGTLTLDQGGTRTASGTAGVAGCW
jgi:type IV pilus assembly protein PilE